MPHTETITEVVAHYRDLLHLANWVIDISDEPPADDCMADIAPVYGQRVAVLRIDPQWPTWDAATLHATVVHELLHLHVEHAAQVAEDAAAAVAGAAGPVVRAAVNLALEYAVDGIAVAVTPHLPAPAETDSRRGWRNWRRSQNPVLPVL